MTGPDPYGVGGATLPVEERADLLVIGAGPAGLGAATAAARAGMHVVVVDENPIPAESMAEDVPHYFGGRASPIVRNRAAMTEAFIAADPALEIAFDAGVDLRLGTLCWGLYANGPNLAWLPGPVAGVSDGARSWLIGADRILVATGARDMALAFDGWAQPGVMGMQAALLLARLNALDVQRAVVLGSSAQAIEGAYQMQLAGIEVVALVEPGPVPLADPGALPLLCNHEIRRAESGPAGVSAVIVSDHGAEQRIACDTIVTAIALVPLVELLDSAGCRTIFSPACGCAVPVLDDRGRTSVPGILAAGDCTGIWPEKSLDPSIAAAEGYRAVMEEGGILALVPGTSPGTSTGTRYAQDAAAYRLAWVRSTVLASETDPDVCQCEGVTAREILEVRPPRYLGAANPRRNRQDLSHLLGNGPPSPDQVKRLTRAGMGLCQGRRCRDQVACLLALSSGLPLAEIPMATHRAPVRPLPLGLAAAETEDPGLAAHWDVWFGMRSQYRSFWDLPARYTVATRHDGGKTTE